MYSILIKKYEAQKRQYDQEHEKIKTSLKDEFEKLTKQYLQLHNKKVIEIHNLQQKIQSKNKAVGLHQATATKSLDKWIELYNSLNEALKSAGDLVNYSTFIDAQLKQVKGQ